MAPERQTAADNRGFLKSFAGVMRIVQFVLGASLWATIAANKYDGPVHFVLLVAVLAWLLTVAFFLLTLLGKQDLVPVVGGDRWLLSNAVHDLAAATLYLPAIGVIAYKTERSAYCNLAHYGHLCLYHTYLAATVLSVLCAAVYLMSGVHASCRRCRGEHALF